MASDKPSIKNYHASVEEIKNMIGLETHKFKLITLNPHIVCMLCAGYFVNATTIVECLHTFCKSCIVKYIQIYKKCPTCGNSLPETEPLSALMLDRTMQDIMKKILPHIEEDEKRRETEFLNKVKTQQQAQEKEDSMKLEKPMYDLKGFSSMLRTDEQINIFLQPDPNGLNELNGVELTYLNNPYVRCSSRIKIIHVKKMVKKLYEPRSLNYSIELTCDGVLLKESLTLRMVYVMHWNQKSQPMVLMYKFLPT